MYWPIKLAATKYRDSVVAHDDEKRMTMLLVTVEQKHSQLVQLLLDFSSLRLLGRKPLRTTRVYCLSWTLSQRATVFKRNMLLLLREEAGLKTRPCWLLPQLGTMSWFYNWFFTALTRTRVTRSTANPHRVSGFEWRRRNNGFLIKRVDSHTALDLYAAKSRSIRQFDQNRCVGERSTRPSHKHRHC